MTTWILCPNLRGARLFQLDDAVGSVTFLKELRRPKRQLRDEDFPTDDSMPEATQDPAVYKDELEVAEELARTVSQHLDEAFRAKRFDSLILCAESQLLAILKRSLSIDVEERLLGTVELDLYNVNESDLINYVKDFRRAAA
jgi:protein required for attachment to host cells